MAAPPHQRPQYYKHFFQQILNWGSTRLSARLPACSPDSSLLHCILSPAPAHEAHHPHSFLRDWPEDKSLPRKHVSRPVFYMTFKLILPNPSLALRLSPQTFIFPQTPSPTLYPFVSSEPVLVALCDSETILSFCGSAPFSFCPAPQSSSKA